jgi:hypothetical protein
LNRKIYPAYVGFGCSIDDEVRSLFLYKKGAKRITNVALRQLPNYMENINRQNAANENLKELQDMVEKVKK